MPMPPEMEPPRPPTPLDAVPDTPTGGAAMPPAPVAQVEASHAVPASSPTAHGSVPALAQWHGLMETARTRVREHDLRPPLPLDTLRQHAHALLALTASEAVYHDFATLLMSNAVWEETVAAVPYTRRIFLLPQCLRDPDGCPAAFDALGLLCQQCGRCVIGRLQARAEALGYVVLVAEGTTVVTQLLAQGKADAVIGVSCLPVLEKAFAHMASMAIPGLAFPLLRDGCTRTETDAQWVLDALARRTTGSRIETRDNPEETKEMVQGWFSDAALRKRMGEPQTHADRLARTWLERGGKRWRPFLTAACWRALTPPESRGETNVVQALAIAVECFHKASLVHDDIEDGDASRYGQDTLHVTHGIPVALNVGDLLIGEGYRLIAESGAPPERMQALLAAASRAHVSLCRGQGEELAWRDAPTPLSCQHVLAMFRLKTAPAFAVALELGAICAGATESTCAALRTFSDALGVAYQIRDDLEDLEEKRLLPLAPSILLAIASEEDAGQVRAHLRTSHTSVHAAHDADATEAWVSLFQTVEAPARAEQLLRHARQEALRSLEAMPYPALQHLLRQALTRILGP